MKPSISLNFNTELKRRYEKKISTKTQVQISALKLYYQENFSTKLQRANFSSYSAPIFSALKYK